MFNPTSSHATPLPDTFPSRWRSRNEKRGNDGALVKEVLVASFDKPRCCPGPTCREEGPSIPSYPKPLEKSSTASTITPTVESKSPPLVANSFDSGNSRSPSNAAASAAASSSPSSSPSSPFLRHPVDSPAYDLRPVLQASDHLTMVRDEVLSLSRGADDIVLDGTSLRLSDVVAIGRRWRRRRGREDGKSDDVVRVELSEDCRNRVDESVAFLAAALAATTATGGDVDDERGSVPDVDGSGAGGAVRQRCGERQDIYGVTTGFGGSSSVRTRDVVGLQRGLISGLCAGSLRCGTLPESTVRSAMAVRANCLLRGASAIRWEVIERLVALLNSGVTPVVPLRASVSASGDLVPLAYVAAVLTGRPEARATLPCGREVSAPEALRFVGIESGAHDAAGASFELLQKEGLALVNGTPVCAAEAAMTLFHSNIVIMAAQVASALACEGMLGSTQSFVAPVHKLRPHLSQLEVAGNILHLLQGSRLVRDESLGHVPPPCGDMQDRYGLRTIPQWLGPHLDVLSQASRDVVTEMNSVTDNPIIDLPRSRVLHGGNFQGSVVATWMDATRTSLAAVGKLLFAQFSEIANVHTNRGLSRSLAGSDPRTDLGLKGCDIAMASYVAELTYLANPVATHSVSAEEANQDVNSMALVSARYTAEAVRVVHLMLATHIYACLQAVDLRATEVARREVCERVVDDALSDLCEDLCECAVVTRGSSDGRRRHEGGADPREVLRDALHPALSAVVSQCSPLRFAFSAHDGYRDLVDLLRSALVAALAEVAPLAPCAAVSKFVQRVVDGLDQRLSRERIRVEACDCGAATMSGRDFISPRLVPLYDFVRRNLGVAIATSGTDMPGPKIDRVYDSFEDGRIGEVLLSCFGENSFPEAPKETRGERTGAEMCYVLSGRNQCMR